jgi:hypothetical protein
MADFQSDAFVFFGATGDLAHKQIFPSLQGLIRDEGFNLPIVGVAKAGWNLDQLKARAKDSLEKHGGLDQDAFNKLTGLLRYVDGDYNDPKTFAQLRKELGSAKQPLHYLAIPPTLFGTVAEGLAKSGCSENARVVVEKPFGRDLASAQELNRILHRYFPEERIFRIDHFLGKNRYRTFSTPASRIQCLNRSGIATTCEASRSPWRRSSESRIAAILRRSRHGAGCGSKSRAASLGQPDHGSANRRGSRRVARPEGRIAQGSTADYSGGRCARPVQRLSVSAGCRCSFHGRDFHRAQAVH